MNKFELHDKWVLEHLKMAFRFQDDYFELRTKNDRRLFIQEVSFAISDVTDSWRKNLIENNDYFTIIRILTGCIDRFYEEAFTLNASS